MTFFWFQKSNIKNLLHEFRTLQNASLRLLLSVTSFSIFNISGEEWLFLWRVIDLGLQLSESEPS